MATMSRHGLLHIVIRTELMDDRERIDVAGARGTRPAEEGGLRMRAIRSSIIGVAMLIGLTVGGVALAGEDPTSRPPIPSAGCGSSTVESGMYPDNELEVDGLVRTWAMYVPDAHDGVMPVPLWLHFHQTPGVASDR